MSDQQAGRTAGRRRWRGQAAARGQYDGRRRRALDVMGDKLNVRRVEQIGSWRAKAMAGEDAGAVVRLRLAGLFIVMSR